MIYLDPSVISYTENDTVLRSEIYEELAKIIDHEILMFCKEDKKVNRPAMYINDKNGAITLKFNDGTVTTAIPMEGDVPDLEKGFCMAWAKKDPEFAEAYRYYIKGGKKKEEYNRKIAKDKVAEQLRIEKEAKANRREKKLRKNIKKKILEDIRMSDLVDEITKECFDELGIDANKI